MSRYGIAEWFGEPLSTMPVSRRHDLARVALGEAPPLPCPFQSDHPPCSKDGGVCSIRSPDSESVVTCPNRFEEGDLIPRWLARIVGFKKVCLAREVPFMRAPKTGHTAGRIDLVVAGDDSAVAWFGLERQAVYFSGTSMRGDVESLLASDEATLPETSGNRRPDWRSSSARRLMPQRQVKAPTLRRWGTGLAVAVDLPFFDAIGGAGVSPSQDLDDGDIVWLVPRMTDACSLEPHHWEVLSLEDSSIKLLSAETVKRGEFEDALRAKLKWIGE